MNSRKLSLICAISVLDKQFQEIGARLDDAEESNVPDSLLNSLYKESGTVFKKAQKMKEELATLKTVRKEG